MMRGCPIRIEQPTLDASELAESRERETLRPDEAPGYAEWSALQLAWSRLSDSDRAFVARIARVLAEGAVP